MRKLPSSYQEELVLPLASGVSPAREAGSGGDMTEVAQGRELSGPLCSHSVPFKMTTRKATAVVEDGVTYILSEDGEKYKAGPINGLVCCEIYNQLRPDPDVSESGRKTVKEGI